MDTHLQELKKLAYSHINSDPKQAIKDGKKLIREAERQKELELVAMGHFIVGSALFSCGRREDMLFHGMHAVAYFKTTTDYGMLARAQNLLGNAYAAEEEQQFSLMAYLDAKKCIKKGRIRYIGDYIDNNIAAAYAELGELEKAITLMKKLFNKLNKAKKKEWDLLNIVCFNLADYYSRLDQPEEAAKYLHEYEKSWGHGSIETENVMYNALRCRIAYTTGDVAKGNQCSDELTECLKRGEENFEMLPSYEIIALHQIKIGEFDRADFYADYLWDYCEKTRLPIDIIRACRVQAEYFNTIGEYEQTLYYYRIMDEQFQIKERNEKKSQLRILEQKDSLDQSVEQMKLDMERQKFLSDRDPMTQLLNRSSMTKVLERYMARAKEKNAAIGCIFIDVDFFKEYNDTYGHVKGDECLKKISNVCLEVEKDRKHIHFARYGGDEFFGMMSGYTDQEVQEIAREIARNVRRLGIMHGHQRVRGQITVSIGVMNLTPDNVNSILDLVTFSDKALYHSKGNGKDCIYMFDQKVYKETEEFEYKKIEYM